MCVRVFGVGGGGGLSAGGAQGGTLDMARLAALLGTPPFTSRVDRVKFHGVARPPQAWPSHYAHF